MGRAAKGYIFAVIGAAHWCSSARWPTALRPIPCHGRSTWPLAVLASAEGIHRRHNQRRAIDSPAGNIRRRARAPPRRAFVFFTSNG